GPHGAARRNRRPDPGGIGSPASFPFACVIRRSPIKWALMNISPEVKINIKELVALRRTIHQNPEQGFKEFKTAALVRSRLKSWGVDYKAMCGTGTVAL